MFSFCRTLREKEEIDSSRLRNVENYSVGMKNHSHSFLYQENRSIPGVMLQGARDTSFPASRFAVIQYDPFE